VVTLIRIGVAMANKDSVFGPSKYQGNWAMKSLTDLIPLYNKVMHLLTKEDHGEYLAMRELFEEEVAIGGRVA
jgi:hypothetical protein